jgi:crossover junction endodeoxyribonuclease RusA
MEPLEFIVLGCPISGQTKQRSRLQDWKDLVRLAASSAMGTGMPIERKIGLRLSIVYLSDAPAPDVDNIIKPIQDALVGMVYCNDLQITDVDCHRRKDAAPNGLRLPVVLRHAIKTGAECVYVRVSDALPLEAYL